MDPIFTDSGQLVLVHAADVCQPPCCIHAPSDHHMQTWPLHWRGDRGIMERLCSHSVGHPDPDDARVRLRRGEGVHGCDGCCIASLPGPGED